MRFNGKCFYCNNSGHKEENCPERIQEEGNLEQQQSNFYQHGANGTAMLQQSRRGRVSSNSLDSHTDFPFFEAENTVIEASSATLSAAASRPGLGVGLLKATTSLRLFEQSPQSVVALIDSD